MTNREEIAGYISTLGIDEHPEKFLAIADYILAREEQAKKDVAEKALKAILSGNSQEIDNFRNYCKEIGQAQDK